MAEPVGLDLATRVASSLRATGKVTGAALTTTIAGIGTARAISIGIGATIATSGQRTMPGGWGPGILCFGAFWRFTGFDKCFAVSGQIIFCSVFH
jgi:hypothetical protein